MSERSRASAPWLASTLRVAFAMFAFTMRWMPHAASVIVDAERLGHVVEDRGFGRGDVEVHAPAREPVGGQVAEHRVGVGDGRAIAAAAVTDRAGRRAGRFGPDEQRALAHRAIEPPPAPTLCTSTIGSPM